MMYLWLLFLCWCSSIAAVINSIEVDGYCLSAYWNSVTCILNITANPMDQSAYNVKFSSTGKRKEEKSCPLLRMDHGYSCVCNLTKYNLKDYNQYNINLCHETECTSIERDFKPSQNIQLTPPLKPDVQQTLENLNITWKSGYETHLYLDKSLSFEVLLQSSKSKGSKTLDPNSNMFLLVEKSKLELNDVYYIQVRSKPNNPVYAGHWSGWSQATSWKNEVGEEQDNILVILTKTLGPVCAAAGILLFLFFSPTARMKIKTLSHTPSPAPFFKPLFQQHEGNIHEWLSPHGKLVLTYNTEEILTTDSVIVVPKPIAKCSEENQDFPNPSVTQVAVTQCHNSYVGLPGIHEPPPPLTLVCPGNMSYTPVPCPVWGIGFGEVEVVSSPPKDILNTSSADSGCSCEDLSKSPEDSLPSSPVVDLPPQCVCTDYCILNKTAEGFAPVLVSKGNNFNAQTGSLQENDS